MRGRSWMFIGAAAGIAVAVGRIPYLAGAARSLSDTAQHLVGDGGTRLIDEVASSGGPMRLVLGLAALVAVLLPGATSFLLVAAARGTLRMRAIAGLVIVALGIIAYFYQPKGVATGEIALTLAVAAVAIFLSGPLVAAPLAGLAALIGAEFLPQIVEGHSTLATANVGNLHQALLNSAGTPGWLQVVLLVIAAVPFAFAARLLLRS
jgi:hypothetical protein